MCTAQMAKLQRQVCHPAWAIADPVADVVHRPVSTWMAGRQTQGVRQAAAAWQQLWQCGKTAVAARLALPSMGLT